MVIFIGWARLKLREVKSSIPVHHTRDSIPHQLSAAPRPVLTPHSSEDSPIDNFSFPLFPSFFLTPPHTHRNGERKSVNQKALRSPCLLQHALQPALTSSCCHMPSFLPCLAIREQPLSHCPDPPLPSLLCCASCSTRLSQLRDHPDFLPQAQWSEPLIKRLPVQTCWLHPSSRCASPLTPLISPPFEAESPYIAQAGSNLVCNSGAPFPHLPSMLASWAPRALLPSLGSSSKQSLWHWCLFCAIPLQQQCTKLNLRISLSEGFQEVGASAQRQGQATKKESWL